MNFSKDPGLKKDLARHFIPDVQPKTVLYICTSDM